MFWDIAISVLAAICQLLTVWLGLRITMNPIDPKDPKLRKKRILYEGSFVLVGVLGVIFVGLAAYRAPRERAHLSIVPSVTYEELGKKPSWLDGAPFLQINKPLAFNIVYQ